MHILNRNINREYCHILLQKEHLWRYSMHNPIISGKDELIES